MQINLLRLVVLSLWVLGTCAECQSNATDLPPIGFEQLKVTILVAEECCESEARLPLLVHFHGAPDTTADNFRRSGLSGVLATVNCQGLSSAYRRPFEDQKLFPYVIEFVRRQLIDNQKLSPDASWERIDVSCFSAGYGAVRELLKNKANQQRIDAIIAADSIYASIHLRNGQRQVDERQMAPFLTFARKAMDGDKLFLVSHSQLHVEPYASTVETAEYLLRKACLTRRKLAPSGLTSFNPISEASRGKFSVIWLRG